MAVMMELEESVSDSKLHKESTAKKDLRPSSAISFSKSDHGPGAWCIVSLTYLRILDKAGKDLFNAH